MDPSAPKTVITGVAITCKFVPPSICGATAGLYGAFKQLPPGNLFLYSAVNGGIAAATFFSIREYIVGPALVLTHPGKQYQLRRERLIEVARGSVPETPSLSWNDIRVSRLLDSGISGALAGGILNTWKRGKPGLVPGLSTGGMMCMLLQWTFNEFDIIRISYLAENSGAQTQPTPAIAKVTAGSPRVEAPLPPIPQATTVSPPESSSFLDSLFSKFGRKVSNEEYVRRLRAQRDSHLRRIAELEEEEERKA
ncbi:hypothetical protein HYDPIDRAFT_24179 [Hydnomerulius pinastri MD-312]|nr:hypothetical protein HYDPIDRAFT_24179 [Hydnomerulius pinastri MD-312]